MRYLIILVLFLVCCSKEPVPVTVDAGPSPVIVVIGPVPSSLVEEEEVKSGPESDCTGVMLTQFSEPGEPLRRGMAAMGSVIGTGGDFDPMIYFHTTDGAKKCAKGSSMDVATWTGRKWKVNK